MERNPTVSYERTRYQNESSICTTILRYPFEIDRVQKEKMDVGLGAARIKPKRNMLDRLKVDMLIVANQNSSREVSRSDYYLR